MTCLTDLALYDKLNMQAMTSLWATPWVLAKPSCAPTTNVRSLTSVMYAAAQREGRPFFVAQRETVAICGDRGQGAILGDDLWRQDVSASRVVSRSACG